MPPLANRSSRRYFPKREGMSPPKGDFSLPPVTCRPLLAGASSMGRWHFLQVKRMRLCVNLLSATRYSAPQPSQIILTSMGCPIFRFSIQR
jgi:hypothetical protein